MGIEVAVAVIGTIASVYSSQQQAKATKKAAQAQGEALDRQTKAQQEAEAAKGRAATVQAQQERIKSVREARVRRASIIAESGNAGLGAGTSGVRGSVGSISSQLSGNIGRINQQETFAEQGSAANMAAAQAGADYNIAGARGAAEVAGWQTIGKIGGAVSDFSGGWTSIFGGNTSVSAQKLPGGAQTRLG